ncbi:MAG: NADH-quinone oxidoreductase subunit NuoE [Opitutales bacterium]|nr:NADH-quinone oxidoreductase subunit NuoE [Opitutales bacterium]
MATTIYQDILKAYSPRRENLVTAFQDIQEKEGYISEEAIAAASEYFSISKADAYSVVSFYAQFKFKKPGKHTIKVCKGTACHVRGSGSLLAALEERLGIKEGETTPDGLISLERVACLGACALAPAMVVDDKVHARITLAQLEKILKELK